MSSIIANPFGTINDGLLLDQHNEHEQITRRAFACDGEKSDGICFEKLSLNQLAGTHVGPVTGLGTNGAVGSPDTLDPIPEGGEAHCDDADFLAIPGYPHSRVDANTKLQECADHLRNRFGQGWKTAERLLDSDNQIRKSMVDLSSSCTFSFPFLQVNLLGRAKCNALEGFGRALHGVQDFYSHSNWADHEDTTQPISDINPPGLGFTDNAQFLDLRAENNISSMIPHNLTTGCFTTIGLDKTPGILGCKHRVTHHTLNKDHGIINLDGSFGPIGTDTPRSGVPGNFELAVNAAVRDSKNQWDNFRREVRLQYGAERGNLILCALVRDDPVKDCRNRKIAIVVDSSGSNSWTDPSNLRIQVAKDFNSKLTTYAQAGEGVPDNVAVIDFDDYARVIYPMGDPAGAKFDSIDSSGGTDIGSGISLAIDEILRDQPGVFAKRSGMIVLTDGEDFNPANQILQLGRAYLHGIRVNFGFLDPIANPVPLFPKRSLGKRDPGVDLMAAILKTGGIFGTINSAAAQKNFVDLVIARGATEVDAPIGNVILVSGVAVADILQPGTDERTFSYLASAGERLNFTVTPKSSGTSLKAVLHDIRQNINIGTLNTVGLAPSSISYNAVANTALELVVSSASGNTTTDIVFSVSIDTNMPVKNITTTTMFPEPTASPSSGYSTALYTNPSTGLYPNATSTSPYINVTSSGFYFNATTTNAGFTPTVTVM